MARNRKGANVHIKPPVGGEKLKPEPSSSQIFKTVAKWKTCIGFAFLVVAIYFGVVGYYETRVNTPFDDKKVVQQSGLAVPERYWGSYRPGVYVGMKARDPRSPVFGLMWYDPQNVATKGIRHWCNQADNLPTYGWLRHDGVSFGEQMIMDPPHRIHTSFIKTPGGGVGGQWTLRVNVTSMEAKKPIQLIWYGALDETFGPAAPLSNISLDKGVIKGYTPDLLRFRVSIYPLNPIIIKSSTQAHAPGVHLLKDKLYSLLREADYYGQFLLHKLVVDPEVNTGKSVNFIVTQMFVVPPFTMDVVFTADDFPSPPLKADDYTKALYEKRAAFDREFEEKFRLEEKGYSETDISIARAALSNMLGGIGYFYGSSRVVSPYTKESVPYWRAPLYTAVPSRSFFPRGFLWDEGFHGLLIGHWNQDIQMDIAAHWLDLINVEGWIPREQILGAEAHARVPKEFVIQSNAAANPPMLLLQLARFVRSRPHLFKPEGPYRGVLDRMFPRLQAWYQWFLTTQKGEEPTSFRWRGRVDNGVELNPKTLTSGLDDYPRASHPSDIERHVDLRCWMFAAAESMVVIANALGRDGRKFADTRDELGDETRLNELHWSAHTQTYADYGLHTDGVRLVTIQPKVPTDQPQTVRSVQITPQIKLVSSAFGYVSLFPMLLKVLKPESEKLGLILDSLDRPELLWSPFGLRSLSKSSPLYMKRNTRDDPPYWRGQVWININYLALAALKHYATMVGPFAERAKDLHARLSANVVNNVLNEYKRTGYLWEQYSGEDGKASGCRPFTGWTALITLIMAEEY